uniref:Zinc finger transcription factor n=1 Tax=Cercospora zeina TaxID=348901 RepID=A0A1Y0K5I1_9PEZI|nr:zinc finger transcription factor [Cercospora zeina]
MARGGASDMPNTRDTSFKRPKIRESCTHCSSQKIRCTKERPACARCVNKGLLCQYNISRRTGTRRPSIRATPEPDTLKPMAPTSSASADSIVIHGRLSPSLSDLAMLDGLDAFDDSMWAQPVVTNVEDMDMQYFDFFSAGGFEAEPEAKGLSGVDSTPLSPTEVASGLSKVGMEASTRPSSSASPRSQRGGGSTGHGGGGGGCISTALQIFSELHVSGSACPIAAGSADQDVRDFDHVLDSNRTALERLSSILDCRPCCRNHEVLTAAFLAIHKALSWYSAALDVASDDEPSSTSSSSRVTSPPAFLGSYALGTQAQALARAYVVTAQLQQHFQPLMAKLQRISASSSPGACSPSTASLSSVSSCQSSASGSAVVECQQRALQEALEDVEAKIDGIKRA